MASSLVFVGTAASFTSKIASFETVAKRDAILKPIPKQWISKDTPSYGSQSECAKIASYPLIWWILIRVTLLLTFNPANHFSAEREALLGGLHMSPVSILKPVVSRIEEEALSLLVFYKCICTSVAVTVSNHLCLVCCHFSCSTSLFQGHVACLKLYLNRAFREGPGVPIKVTFLARNCIYKQYNVSLPYCKKSKPPFAVASHADVLTDSSRSHSSPTNAWWTPKNICVGGYFCSGVSEPSDKEGGVQKNFFFSSSSLSVDLCIGQIEVSTCPPPGNPPGIWLFWKLLFKFPPTRAKIPFKCPTLGSIQVIKCPHRGDISQAQKWQKDSGNTFSCRTKYLQI